MRESNPLRRPLTDREREDLRALLRADDVFPIRIGGPHDLEIGGFDVSCRGCDRDIPPSFQRARVRQHDASLVVIDIAGICSCCRSAIPGVIRVRPEEGRYETWFKGSGWRFYRLVKRPRVPPWWDLMGWVRRCLGL